MWEHNVIFDYFIILYESLCNTRFFYKEHLYKELETEIGV